MRMRSPHAAKIEAAAAGLAVLAATLKTRNNNRRRVVQQRSVAIAAIGRRRMAWYVVAASIVSLFSLPPRPGQARLGGTARPCAERASERQTPAVESGAHPGCENVRARAPAFSWVLCPTCRGSSYRRSDSSVWSQLRRFTAIIVVVQFNTARVS